MPLLVPISLFPVPAGDGLIGPQPTIRSPRPNPKGAKPHACSALFHEGEGKNPTRQQI